MIVPDNLELNQMLKKKEKEKLIEETLKNGGKPRYTKREIFELLVDIITTIPVVKNQVKEFKRRTNKSQATFFRYKKKLYENYQNYQNYQSPVSITKLDI